MKIEIVSLVLVSLLAGCGNYRTEKGGGGGEEGGGRPAPSTTPGGGSNGNNGNNNGNGGNAGNTLAATYQSIQTNILNAKCVRCHRGASPDGDVDLTRYARFVEPPTVRPGEPERSTLYLSLLREEGWMPRGGDRLSVEERKAVFDWIKAGAPRE